MRGSKGILGLVVLLALALVVSVPVVSASGSSGDTAVAAKKKCKKKKPHAAKKKKCKKKKKQQTSAPIVRATLVCRTVALTTSTWISSSSMPADSRRATAPTRSRRARSRPT